MFKRTTLIILWALCVHSPIHAEEPVYFADADLKACVESTLGITDPTPTDMLVLTSLTCIYKGIADLTGLEYASNLQMLNLERNQISDLSPLSGLTNLTQLYLWSNQISDLSPLSGLTNLTQLYLWSNQISDLSPLSGLTNLQWLNIGSNQISDLSPLAGLTNLTNLDLEYNQISDLSPLDGLTNLTHLDLHDNQISDLSPLAGLTNLTYLGLEYNHISDLSPLAGLTNLIYLYLNHNQISDLSPISGLTNLTYLGLEHNHISDLSPLSGLTNLQDLGLSDNQISDLSPLAGLTNLTWLVLGYNQISDLSPLAGLTNLTNLYLHFNQISDLSPLSGLTNLEELDLRGNPLNREACDVYIPLIIANNPGITIKYDPCSLQKPAVNTDAATQVGQTTATLRGTVTSDGGEACQYRFRYKKSGGPYTYTSWTGSATTGQSFSEAIIGLDYGFTYYFNAQAKNSAGESNWGNEQSFTTGTSVYIPSVNTLSATNVGQTSATLRGQIENDGGEACQYRFRYKKSGGSYTYTSWTGSVTTGQSFSEAISGLDNGFTYYFNAQAKNSAGESNWGSEQIFTTGVSVSVPSVTTQSATNVSQTSATLHGSIADDGGQACKYRFRYKKSGGSYTYTPLTGSVTTGQIFSETLSGLTPGSTYYFNAQAKNSAGESDWGSERSFKTDISVSVLSVSTQPATNIGETAARLWGRIEDDGGEACRYRFEYWRSGFWVTTSWSYDTKTTGESFYKDISSLRPGCIYHFKAQAKNSAGESDWSSEQSFTTLQSLLQAGLTGLVVELDLGGQPLGPLSGAKVTLKRGATTKTVYSNNQGQFQFSGLNPGTYSVTASKGWYYPLPPKDIVLAAGETKFEVLSLTQQPEPGIPVMVDFSSPNGKNFIEGMPGNLSFSTVVAWNGLPGSVRFQIAGTWHTANVTDLGNGIAQATLTIAAPSIISSCSELKIEVTNGEGQTTYINAGIHFYPIPGIIIPWYRDNIPWTPSGLTLAYSEEASWTFWDFEIPSGVYSSSASLGLHKDLSYDLLAGTFSGSIGGFGTFNQELEFSGVENLGEGQLDLSSTLAVAFAGCNPPIITPSWDISVTGKAGIGAPVVLVVDIIFPPAAPTVHWLLNVPIVKDVLEALKVRVFLIGGLGLSGKYVGGQQGSCFLGATSLNLSGTFGLEGQALVEAYGASVGISASLTGTPEFQICPDLEFEGLTLRGYVGVFAYVPLFVDIAPGFGVEIRFDSGGQQGFLAMLPIPASELVSAQGTKGSWKPIGNSCLRWGEANRMVDSKPTDGIRYFSLGENTGSEEKVIVENVGHLAIPSIICSDSETLILFSLHDPNKPWYAATDIATVHQEDGQPWELARIADDEIAEFAPQVITVDPDTILAAWEMVSGDISGTTSPDEVAPHIEIVASQFELDTGVWSMPEQLTSNEIVDHAPLPIAYGNIQGILWIQNEGNAMIGDANSGDRLMFTKQSPNGWNEAQTLWSASKGILGFAFVADGLGGGHIVFAVDDDGNLETRNDRELYSMTTVNDIWQTAIRLTDDAVEDVNPTLVAPNGVPMCIWNSDGTLTYSYLNDWNPTQVYSEYTIANEASSLDAVTIPDGAAIAYTTQGPNGVDIVASFYDANLDCWSLPRQLTEDEHAESAISLAHDSNDLVIAYLKTQTVRSDVDVEINGEMHHLENIPQPGRTDLYTLRHTLGNDIAVVADSLVVEPMNPAPDEIATLRVTVENQGDLPLQNVQVTFYDGDPNNGGIVIRNTQTIDGILIAGGKREVSVTWQVPSFAESHQIFVVVDPYLTIDDRNRSNNTSYMCTVLPDFTIETCWSTEISDATMVLTARVVNTGVIPSEAFDVSWRLGAADGEEIGKSTINTLGPAGAYEAAYVWEATSYLNSGQSVQVFVVVDSAVSVVEFDETNNVHNLAVFRP